MRNYQEEKKARANQRTAMFITASIYFLLFTGVFFATQPEKLPDFIKDWLKIENVETPQEKADTKPKDRA